MEALKSLNNMTKAVAGIILSLLIVNISADKGYSSLAILAHMTGVGLSGAVAYQQGKKQATESKTISTAIAIESTPANITESPKTTSAVKPVTPTTEIERSAPAPIKTRVPSKPIKVEASDTENPFWERLNAEAEDENTGAYLLKELMGSKWQPNLKIKNSHIVDVSYVSGGAIEYKNGVVETILQLFIEVERPVTWHDANEWVRQSNYLQQSTAISSGEKGFKYSPNILTKIKAEGHLVIVAISNRAFVC